MLSYLSGTIKNIHQNSLTILVNGVGFEVFASEKLITEYKKGDEIELSTYLQVTESALTLYGFKTQKELGLFKLLISVSGIGPKVGLKVLEKISVAQLQMAILNEDIDLLKSVPGIGGKTAQRLLVELKSKIDQQDIDTKGSLSGSLNLELRNALKGLGYDSEQINEVVTDVPSEFKTVEQQLKYVLKLLSK